MNFDQKNKKERGSLHQRIKFVRDLNQKWGLVDFADYPRNIRNVPNERGYPNSSFKLRAPLHAPLQSRVQRAQQLYTCVESTTNFFLNKFKLATIIMIIDPHALKIAINNLYNLCVYKNVLFIIYFYLFFKDSFIYLAVFIWLPSSSINFRLIPQSGKTS